MITIIPEDVLNACCEVHTGKEFYNVAIVTLETKMGYIDTLFDKEGHLVHPGQQDEIVNRLSSFYSKSFTPASIENTPCFISILS